MNNKSFFELWILDSAIRGMDPVARFLHNIYLLIWAPLVVIGVFCFLTDTNYFWFIGLLCKGIWVYWFKTIWYLMTHYDKVVWLCRNLFSPGCCGPDPGF